VFWAPGKTTVPPVSAGKLIAGISASQACSNRTLPPLPHPVETLACRDKYNYNKSYSPQWLGVFFQCVPRGSTSPADIKTSAMTLFCRI